ncbi:MAG: anti-sigma factor [Solirubrobacterales bacterium]|nr:anti-sigma factor [Solirubrobacterales bacterium]
MTSGHQRFKEQLPAYALGALDPAERGDLRHHLEGCAECRAELEWLAPATTILAADVEQIEPSPGVRAKVMAAVDADLAENPATETRPLPAAKSRDRRSPGWLAGLFRPAVFGAAAAALFLGVALGVVISGSEDPAVPERQVVTGEATNGANAVMVASDGTGTLKMTGLKRPDEDQVYQAWIQRGTEVIPTDSLFVPDRQGSATASIPDLSGVTAVMVSMEPKGGSKQPTTAPVITVSMPS